MTTDTGFAPDLSFLNLPDDKLQKVSEVLNNALQAHQALNSFDWYKRSAGAAADAVKKEVGSLKKQLTDEASKRFENLAAKVEDKTGVNIRGMIPTGGDSGGGGIFSDIAGKAMTGDFKGAARAAGQGAKDEAMKRMAAADPRLANIADKALSGDFKGAAVSAGDIAKKTALDELRKVNPDAAKFMDEALDGNLEGAARNAALGKLKQLNPEAAQYVERAMTGDIKGAARAAAVDQLQKVNPDAARYAKQALDGDVQGAAKAATLDQLEKANPEMAKYAKQALDGDVEGAAKAAVLDQLKKADPDMARLAEEAMSGNIDGAAKMAAMEQLRKANPDAADMVDKIMNGKPEDVVKSAVLDQVRKANPETAQYVEQAMKGDLKSTATTAAMDQLRKMNPDVASIVDNLSSGAPGGDFTSMTKSYAMQGLQNARDTLGSEYQARVQGVQKQISDIENKGLRMDEFGLSPDDVEALQQKRTELRSVLQNMKDEFTQKQADLTSQIERFKASVPDVASGVKTMTSIVQDPSAMKQAVVESVKSKLSSAASPLMNSTDEMKTTLGKEGLKMFEGGDSVLKNLSTMSDQSFREFLQSSKAAQMFDGPLVKTVTEGDKTNLFRKQKFMENFGDDDFETGRRFADSSAAMDRGESFFTKTSTALSDTLNKLKSPLVTGSDSTIARATRPPTQMETEMKDLSVRRAAQVVENQGVKAPISGEEIGSISAGTALNEAAGVAGLADAVKSGNKPAIGMSATGLAANTTASAGEVAGGAVGDALALGGEATNQALGAAGLALAIKDKDSGAVAQQSAQIGISQASSAMKPATGGASNSMTTQATDDIAQSTSQEAVSAEASVKPAANIGENLGENLLKDTVDTAPLDETGIGEFVDAGLAISQLVTSLVDLFKSSPKQPAIYTGNQVGLS